MSRAPLILASKSKGRCEMLRGAGLDFEVIPADIDEQAITARLLADQADLSETALHLAQEKAKVISAQHPDALVIGSDQILTFEGQLLHKATSSQEAITRLQSMQGKAHHLISSVVVVQGGQPLWSAHDQAQLTMAQFDCAFWEHYQAKAGAALTASVGGYWLEDIGSWLFSDIQGNYFTILGMPLLPLLQYLRTQGVTL